VRWHNRDSLKEIRIGYFEQDGRTPVTEQTSAAVRNAAQMLRDAGFRVEKFCPAGLEDARTLWWNIFGRTGRMLLGPMTSGREADLSPILKEFNRWVAAERPHTAQTLLETWVERDLVRMRVFEQMNRFPVLLCPVAAIPAFRHRERSWQVDGKTVKYLDAWSYCEWFNLLGMPGAVVPVASSAEGLPIGVQIVARPWEEEMVLEIAQAIEEARGEWKPAPL
jgi:Asp-tRNA(Asn)/Glu-tRNA(Gln) amidotransferase A subunit family amidase